MKALRFCCGLMILMALAGMVAAQTTPAAAPAADKNPVTTTVTRFFERFKPNLAGAAEQMPADKYGYKPTDGHQTFGHLIEHVAKSNAFVCSRIADQAAPKEIEDVKDADGKDKLVAALKQSFDFCAQALAKVDDSKLGDQVEWRGGRKVPRATALVELPVDLADHYSAAATYLRMNGMLPPSAQPRR